MPLVGTNIRNIRITDRLGKGGMGEVYLGIDEVLGRKVAVKAIRSTMRPSAIARTRFVREARLLSQLEHPNICRIYEFIEGDECDYIVLELVEGVNLGAALAQGLQPAEKMSIALQVAQGLKAAHSISVVHRDLKPDNIMVGSDGVVKILDFGLARSLPVEGAEPDIGGSFVFDVSEPAMDLDETTITQLGQALGTPMYMSPEQAQGQPLTAASDVYSFGLVLQELFSTNPPYDKDLDREVLFAKAMWGDTLPVDGLDHEFTELIDRMQSLGPGSRPTVEAVAEKLRRIDERPIRRRRRIAVGVVSALLVMAAVSSTIGFLHARRSQLEAQTARTQAEAVNAFLEKMLSSASPLAEGVDVKVVDILDEAEWNLDQEFADRPLDRAAVLHTLGSTYLAIGKFDVAHRHLTSAYELRRTSLGDEHEDTLDSRTSAGVALFKMGRVDDAEDELRQVLDRCDAALGPDHPQTLSAAYDLGLILSSRGAHKEGETLLLRVVDGRRGAFGEEHQSTLTAKEELAVDYRRQGRNEEAEALHREILAIQEEKLGADHPLTMNAVAKLANSLMTRGDYAGAEILNRRVVDIRAERYGVEHPNYLLALMNLATCLSRQKHFEEAAEIGREHVETSTRVLGADHPDTLMGENNLANTYRRWGRPEEAEVIYRSVLERQRRILGDDHPQTANTISNLAKTVQDMGDYEQAIELNRLVVGIRRQTLGIEHQYTLAPAYNLGGALCQAGRWAEAAPILREVYEVSNRVRGSTDSLTFGAGKLLALAMAMEGRIDEALSFIEGLVDGWRETLGEHHNYTIRGSRRIAEVLQIAGRTEEAEAVEAELAVLEAKVSQND